MITLNTKTITDEILALSALHNLQKPPGVADIPLLSADNLPALRRMIRLAFASLMLDLDAEVTDCGLDGADVDPSLPWDDAHELLLRVSLRGEAAWDSSKALAVKRQLEHLTALKALAAAGISADCSRETDTLLAAISTSPATFLRPPAF